MAEWLRRGLQILARRFDSGSGLHPHFGLVGCKLGFGDTRGGNDDRLLSKAGRSPEGTDRKREGTSVERPSLTGESQLPPRHLMCLIRVLLALERQWGEAFVLLGGKRFDHPRLGWLVEKLRGFATTLFHSRGIYRD